MTKPSKKPSPVGGIPFFCALGALAVISALSLRIFISNLQILNTTRMLLFLSGMVSGWIAAQWIIRDHLGVFIHELKHSIVSSLSGNRAKEMKVGSRSGHFSYEYTERTAHMNAFISIAPYVLPLATIAFLFISVSLLTPYPLIVVYLVGCGFGLDIYAHIRDLGPHQSDLSLLRGGYAVGLPFVFLANAVIALVLLFWINAGLSGIVLWFDALWNLAYQLSKIFSASPKI